MDKIYISNISEEIATSTKDAVNVESAVIDENVLADDVVKGNPSPVMEEALTSDFHSEEELKAKKVLSAALLIAKKTGIVSEETAGKIDSVGSAVIADETVTRVKCAIKVATGEIDATEVADKLIDTATARVLAVSDVVVAKGVDIAINKIGKVVARVYPPATPVVMMIKKVQPLITVKAQQLARKGIQKVNTVAKTVARKAITTVKAAGKRLSGFVKSLFS